MAISGELQNTFRNLFGKYEAAELVTALNALIAELSGDVVVATITTTGDGAIGNDLTVTRNLLVSHDITAGDDLDVGGDAVFAGALNFTAEEVDITLGGTTSNTIYLHDNLQNALLIKIDGGNQFLKFDTRNGAEEITLGTSSQSLVFGGTVASFTATNLFCTNIDAGTQGTAGTIDLFPTTAAKGKLQITKADNTNNDTTTLTVAAQGGAYTYTIPDAGGSCQVVMAAGAQTIAGAKTLSSNLLTSSGVGAVAGTGITVQERGDGSMHKSVFTLTGHAITITDAAAAGAHGTTAFYTFPEGHIKIIGGHINLTGIAAGAGGIDDDAELDIGVGQAALGTDNDELTGTEADILLINEKALVAGAATGDAVMGLTNVQIDGSASAGTLNLNVVVDADDVGSNDTITLDGTVTIFWINEGDD